MIESLLLYSIKSAFVLSLLYIPYTLILRKESFFRTNRAVLLLILVLSIALPLMDVSVLSLDNQPVVQVARQQMVEAGIPLKGGVVLPELTVQGTHERTSQMSWFHIASLVFLAGMALVFVWRAVQIARMGLVVRGGSLWHEEMDGAHVYCHANDVSPFSWMNNIVISQRDYEENGREIILHERGHIRACHSWDLLLLSAVQMLQWWNPLAYVFGISLRDVHEYEADDHVLSSGVSARSYQLLLIKKVVGASSYTFANNFDHSLTKKRITMMQKTKSSVWMRSKVLYIIPVATLALSAFATSESTTLSGNEIAKDGDKVIKITPTVQDGKEKSPVIMQSGVSDKDVVYLVDGNQVDAKTLKLAPVIIASITVIKDQEAAKRMGYPGKSVIVIKTKGNETQDWSKVSYNPNPAVPAQFKGGEMALMKWLQKNVKYPTEAQSLGIMGRVDVEFFISEKGEISNVRAIAVDKKSPSDGKSLPEILVTAYAKEMKAMGKELTPEERAAQKEGYQALINESVRVIKSMPAWEPGYADKEKKEPCTTRFVLPVMYRLG